MVSIHPPPLSSPPGPPSQSQVSRLASKRLSSVERRWAPSLWCGMGWGWGAHTCQLHLGPDPTMPFRCVFPGARSITRGEPCRPRGCCCLFGLGGWSVCSWSPDRERTHNPASQVPSDVERPRPGLTCGEAVPPSASIRPPLICLAGSRNLSGPAPLIPQGQPFHHNGCQRLWFWVQISQSGKPQPGPGRPMWANSTS